MKGFKAYDIRGVYNKDFNSNDVYRIGHFLPDVLPAGRYLVGRDHRISSGEIRESLVDGLLSRGVDVYDMGLSTTPMVYYNAGRYHFDASVQITASHNSGEYNGFKVSGPNVVPIGYDNGLNRLEELVERAPLRKSSSRGRIIPLDGKAGFLDFVRRYHHPSIRQLKLAVDCSNGMAGYVIRDILGNQPFYINEEPDGRFPNHDPNPLKKENQKDVQAAVLSEGLDAGVIYDGDADRVVFVDDKGRFVSPDLLIALMGHYFIDRRGERVLQDIRSSRSVKEYLDAFGAEVHTWKVGRAFACPRLRELDALYGGEFAGHYYFRDFYYSDSAMIATLSALEVIARFRDKGVAFSGIIDNICRYSSSGELNYHIEKKQQAIEAVAGHFIAQEPPLDRMDFDGTRLDYDDWWINIRPSNTEPYLRVILEARTPDLLKDKMDVVQGILKAYKQDGFNK